jgi:CRISPR-associated protein Cmr4
MEYLLFLYAESPVHTGAAGSVDVLDLPVQREAATGYPVIWGQSLKGALRQAAEDIGGTQWPKDRVAAVFGSAIGDRGEDGSAGLLAVGDAQLVAMPVPTLRRTFAWLTSEIALGRLARKYARLKRTCPVSPALNDRDGGLAVAAHWSSAGKEVLGPVLVQFRSQAEGPLADWANQIAADALGDGVFEPFAKKLRSDLLLAGADIVPVLLRECTEQAVRVQLKSDSKTVVAGPFYSEYLPTETILAASLTLREKSDRDKDDAAGRRAALSGLLHGQLLQVGGDETLGKGLMWARLLPAAMETA